MIFFIDDTSYNNSIKKYNFQLIVEKNSYSNSDLLALYYKTLHYNMAHPTYDVREFPLLTMNFP